MFDNIDIWTLITWASMVIIVYKIGQYSVYLDLYRAAKRMGLDVDALAKKLQDLDESAESGINSDTWPLQVDKVGEQYLAYSNGTFLAQANDFRGLLDAVKCRFPDRKFILDKFEKTLTDDEAKRLVEACITYKTPQK